MHPRRLAEGMDPSPSPSPAHDNNAATTSACNTEINIRRGGRDTTLWRHVDTVPLRSLNARARRNPFASIPKVRR